MDQTSLAIAPRRAAVAFIFITLLLDMLAVGMIIPVLPKLVERFLGGDTARASEIFGLFGTVWALMQFLFSPLLGALSDRFGRRPVILLSNFGLGLDYILMALAPTLWWLFLGRVISGITAASISTGFAYIADVSPPEKRAANFGLLGATFGIGFILGPAIGGLLGAIDPRLPFWVAAGFSLANGFYGLLILPESLPPALRSGFSWRKANPVGSLTLLRRHAELLGLAGVGFLSNLAHVVLPTTAVLYAGYRYGWDEAAIGLMLAGVGICALLVQVALVGPFVKRFGERTALVTGLMFGAAGFTIYGGAPTGVIFCVGVPVMALWGLASPALQSLMTRHVSASEQGQLQGANSSLMGIASLFGPSLFTLSFAYAIAKGHESTPIGTPFFLAAMIMVAATVMGWRATGLRVSGR